MTDTEQEGGKKEHKIVLCMGSSCFARGNCDNIELARDFVEKNRLGERIILSGALCSELCGNGPVVTIDNMAHCQVDRALLLDLLSRLKSEIEATE